MPTPTPKPKRKPKEKKQIIDSVIELQEGPGKGRGRGNGLGAPVNKDVSGILQEPHFLPRSTIVMRLLEINDDPLAHFLPTKNTPEGTFFCAAPPGIAPELAQMFMRPMNNLSNKRRATTPGQEAQKRARVDEEGSGHEDEVEQARRATSIAPSIPGSDILGRASIGPLDMGDQSGLLDDYQLEAPEISMDPGMADTGLRAGSVLSELSRLSTPAPGGDLAEEGETYADVNCPIATFDPLPSSQTQSTERESDPVDTEGKGYSKNTIKALGIIRNELKPLDGDDTEEKMLSFQRMADKVSTCLERLFGLV